MLSSKATSLHIQCRNCQYSTTLSVSGGFSGVTLPRVCGRVKMDGDNSTPCPMDPYFVVHEKCQFVDQQILKLQEAPDQVPVGELPRHVLISAVSPIFIRVPSCLREPQGQELSLHPPRYFPLASRAPRSLINFLDLMC